MLPSLVLVWDDRIVVIHCILQGPLSSDEVFWSNVTGIDALFCDCRTPAVVNVDFLRLASPHLQD